MKSLNQDLAITKGDRQAELLPQALQYGDTGINLLISLLNDPELVVRAKAYQILRSLDSAPAQQASSQGVLLRSGDLVYNFYQSGISYADSNYILNDFVSESQETSSDDNESEDEIEISDARSSWLSCHVSQSEAELIAESLHRQIILTNGIEEFSKNGNLVWEQSNIQFDLETWCRLHNVPYKSDLDRSSNWHQKILPFLKKPENIHLYSQLAKQAVGRFAFIKAEIVTKSYYLKLDQNNIQRIWELASLIKIAIPERKVKLLENAVKYGNLGINLLIEHLNHYLLEVRYKAYKILQIIDSARAKEAISQGLLLKPGDHLYRVKPALNEVEDRC